MEYSKTGRLIAKKRKDREYTLEKLSKLLGVSPQAISLWENGQRYPDPSSQIMLFKVLGLNPVELIAGTGEPVENARARFQGHRFRQDVEHLFRRMHRMQRYDLVCLPRTDVGGQREGVELRAVVVCVAPSQVQSDFPDEALA